MVRPPSLAVRAAVFLVMVVGATAVGADCAKDTQGEVFCGAGRCAHDKEGIIWCSRFEDGGVAVTRDGEVLCGRGECARTFSGQIYCSSVPGGAVLKDRDGRVRCQSSCEPASASKCENTVADSAR